MLPRAEGGPDSALTEPARSVAATEAAREVLPLPLPALLTTGGGREEAGLAEPEATLVFREWEDLVFLSGTTGLVGPLDRTRLELGVGGSAAGEAARSLPSSLEPSGTVEPAEGEDEGCSERSESSAAIALIG